TSAVGEVLFTNSFSVLLFFIIIASLMRKGESHRRETSADRRGYRCDSVRTAKVAHLLQQRRWYLEDAQEKVP
ncbi:hypothetical protein BS47DRAFT_1350536, partial [Hydnum rufescens UP504]